MVKNEIQDRPLALTFVPSLQLPLGCWRVPNTNTEEETTCAKLGEEEEEAAEDTVKEESMNEDKDEGLEDAFEEHLESVKCYHLEE